MAMASPSPYVACPRCERAMEPGGTCDSSPWRQDGREIPPIPYGSEARPYPQLQCRDCNVRRGGTHHYDCVIERCPHGNQAVMCDDCPVIDDPYESAVPVH